MEGDCLERNDESSVNEYLELTSTAASLVPQESMTALLDDTEENVLHGDLRINCVRRGSWFRLSNGFFFLGSVVYVVTNTIGVVWAYQDLNYDDDQDADSTAVPTSTLEETDDADRDDPQPFWNVYKVLASIAALLYLGNALIDGRVAIGETRQKVGRTRFGDDPRWEIGVAVTFGVAALCDFVSELIWDDNNMWPGYGVGCAAVDTYLLNAVLVVSGRRPAFTSRPQTLMSAGDILFLIGSVIDVLISIVDNPNAPSSRSVEIAWSSWVSAVLWFIDAVLYILAERLSDDGDDGDCSSLDSSESGLASDDDVQSEVEICSSTAPLLMSPDSEHLVDAIGETDARLHRRIHAETSADSAT